jgi:hypothetical protein
LANVIYICICDYAIRSSWEEILELAKAVEEAGATIINTGIGWHEARVINTSTSNFIEHSKLKKV